jgi:hypothetical protein
MGTAIALAALSLSALRLVGPPGSRCPDPARVRAYLGELGVALDASDATARWATADARLHLTIHRSATETSTAALLERDLDPATCDEWTAAVALAIERATQPLYADAGDAAPATPAAPARIEAGHEPVARAGWDVGVHAGALAILGAKASFGAEAGIEAWPGRGMFGIALVGGGTVPAQYDTADPMNNPISLSLGELHAGAGGAVRRAIGGHAWIAGSLMALVRQIRGSPSGSGVEKGERIRDLLAGGRASAWIAYEIGPIELRLEAAVRAMPEGKTYRAVPFVDLAHIPAIEGELLAAAGIARF